MSAHENVRLVKEAYASFQKGNVNAVLDVLANDVVWVSPGPPDVLPLAGERHGREEVRQFFERLANEEAIELFHPTDFVSEGDKVVAFVDYRATIKSTGRSVQCELVHVFTVRDGRVHRFCEYYDTALAAEAYRPATSKASPTR